MRESQPVDDITERTEMFVLKLSLKRIWKHVKTENLTEKKNRKSQQGNTGLP